MTLSRNRNNLFIVFPILLFGMTGISRAEILWSELGDAGESLGTAQAISGMDEITSIIGTIESSATLGYEDVDLFKIYIEDFSIFSATTKNSAALDTDLFLFDSKGFGLASNGDNVFATPPELFATIPSDSVSGSPGIYYIGIAFAGDYPKSVTGRIFPDLFDLSSTGKVLGPISPGGNNPLSNWEYDGDPGRIPLPASYEINLTGVNTVPDVVPEPGSSLLILTGLASLVGLRCRQRLIKKS
ncbi:PEP-CTERM sorting domain-containing protein [Bremerella cremea]|uniref:PEP-CTERM protein-sorting domain-containing protein n=1 Tax=Blastopirellula marina TaxID=124 RepID=A0A2S8FT37_9BACT|nr:MULTISPECIES: PEP-CTERM sorting domain-containing protein [Pirellulaceae]PQO35343.1 hypothetical protein C5Y83_10895 [Blastopirellula marina]RCS48292.1 PEP-CTERM sorting domain-containing protein [Bremerella cremea]